jgi:hypothetical protein
MTNSLALWYRRLRDTATDDEPAKVEVHFNLWRHSANEANDSNFLDIGLLFENAYEVGGVFLFFPAHVSEKEVEDLSAVLRSDTLLSAVFNDVVKLGRDDDREFIATSKGKHFLTFHSVKPGYDFQLKALPAEKGTLLEFTDSFAARLKSPGRHYVRLRLNLSKKAAAEFSTKKEARGAFLASTLWNEEFTEIRFNEMRNVPTSIREIIEDRASRMFNVTSAHCFMIRDLTFELVASHAAMHKMRRMEANLWDGYLPTHLPEFDLSRMMVYHWRASKGPVDSFIALARFRSPRDTIYWYILGIVVFGAMGSALEDFVSGWTWPRPFAPLVKDQPHYGGLGALVLTIALAIMLWFAPLGGSLLKKIYRCLRPD